MVVEYSSISVGEKLAGDGGKKEGGSAVTLTPE